MSIKSIFSKKSLNYNCLLHIHIIYYSHFAKDHLYFEKKKMLERILYFPSVLFWANMLAFQIVLCGCVQSTKKARARFSTCTPLSKPKLG